jgi:hypothetical protein
LSLGLRLEMDLLSAVLDLSSEPVVLAEFVEADFRCFCRVGVLGVSSIPYEQ